jgi:hypothetical protein
VGVDSHTVFRAGHPLRSGDARLGHHVQAPRYLEYRHRAVHELALPAVGDQAAVESARRPRQDEARVGGRDAAPCRSRPRRDRVLDTGPELLPVDARVHVAAGIQFGDARHRGGRPVHARAHEARPGMVCRCPLDVLSNRDDHGPGPLDHLRRIYRSNDRSRHRRGGRSRHANGAGRVRRSGSDSGRSAARRPPDHHLSVRSRDRTRPHPDRPGGFGQGDGPTVERQQRLLPGRGHASAGPATTDDSPANGEATTNVEQRRGVWGGFVGGLESFLRRNFGPDEEPVRDDGLTGNVGIVYFYLSGAPNPATRW